MSDQRIIYLDNAATTRPYPRVCAVMADAMERTFGNPSSIHGVGRQAKRLMEESRETLAELIGAHPDEMYFTSGGTESNNLAITGSCLAFERMEGKGSVITSALEHPSVTKTVRNLRRDGWRTEHLDAVKGDLDLDTLGRLLSERDDVALVTVMSVQSELGYRFPIKEVAALCHEHAMARRGTDPDAASASYPLVHTDAVQAFGKLDV
ncbi:cysteine desulfurase family protein, partial [Slackia exigua]